MAVVQLRAGIYVNSIEEVPAAEQTAAYKYASLFTKARKENWEMSQRQAASEIADAKVRDAAAIKSYDAQIADYNDRLKQLDQDIALTGRDVAKANAATQRTALQEATARQNNEILWEKAKVEGVVVSGASRSRSESESKGGGGTGGGGSSAQKEADDLVNVEIGAQGDGGRDPSALQQGLKQGALQSANISNTDPAVVSAAKAGGVAASVGLLATDYRNGGYSEANALASAEADVLQDLTDNGHQDAVDAYKNKQAVDLAGGGGRTSRTDSSSSRDAATLQPRYPGLPDKMPAADVVTADTAPKVPLDTADLKAARDKLAGQLAALLDRGAPASEVDDFITRSREIMAGRFGRVAESPNFYQRNVAQAILRGDMTNEDIALLRSDYDNRGRPVRILPTPTVEGTPVSGAVPTTAGTPVSGAVPTTTGTPGKLVYDTSYGDTGGFGESEPLGSLKTSQTGARTSPVIPGATPTAAPIVTGGSAPAVSPGASGEAPATAASSAADTAAASGASPAAVGAAAGAAAAAIPTEVPMIVGMPRGGELVRDVEARRQAGRSRQTELDALFPDGVPQEVLDAAAGIRRSGAPSVGRPQMPDPSGATDTAGPYAGQRSDTTPNIGSKPEALGDFSIPDVPSAYNDRPFDPVTNPYGGKFAPNKQSPPVPGEGGAGFKTTYTLGDEVPISDFEREQLIKLKQKAREDAQRKQDAIDDAEDAKKKGKSGSTLEYFKGRFDSAKQIIDQPGKLARLTASGPGKVAADVYNANKTSGKDFKLTYETLTATYEDDKEALATAHQVALALDIASRARTAPPKA